MALARNRYRVFKEKTYDALVSLKQIFHYHFINAQASIPEVQANIVRELEYQSSLELDPRAVRPASGVAAGQRNHPARPPGPRPQAGQLRGGAARNLHAGDRVH